MAARALALHSERSRHVHCTANLQDDVAVSVSYLQNYECILMLHTGVGGPWGNATPQALMRDSGLKDVTW